MADINYGLLSDAIVDAFQRARSTGAETDPLALMSESISDSVDKLALEAEDAKGEGTRGRNELKLITRVVSNTIIKVTKNLASEVILLQRQGLAFNQTFSQTMAKSGEVIRGLPGGLTTSLESLFAFQSQGMMHVGRNTLGLANRMKLTGQSISGLIQLDKALLTQGLMGGSQRERLIKGIDDSSRTYGVAAEGIITAVNQLGEGLALAGLMGSTGPLVEAVEEFATLRPELGDMAGKMVGQLMSQVRTGDLDSLQVHNLGEFADKIIAGTFTAQDIEKMANRIGKIQDRALGGGVGSGGFAAVSDQLKVLGKIGEFGIALDKSIKQTDKQTKGKSFSQLSADFMTAFKEAISPFQQDIGNAATKIGEWAGQFVGFMSTVGGARSAVTALTVLLAGKLFLAINSLRIAIVGMKIPSLIGGIGNALGMGAAAKGAGRLAGLGKWGRAGIWGLAAGVVITGLPMLLNSYKNTEELEAKQLALMEKTYKDQQVTNYRLGQSRFEEVSKMLINQSMIATAAAQAASTEAGRVGFREVVNAVDGVQAAVHKGTTEVTKPKVDARASDPTPGQGD